MCFDDSCPQWGRIIVYELHKLSLAWNKKQKSRRCYVRIVISGNSLENVNRSLIRSRPVHGKCESFAEKSRSEQMKCLQIAKDRELYMELEYRMTSSQYPRCN